jgi:hypothetical protein
MPTNAVIDGAVARIGGYPRTWDAVVVSTALSRLFARAWRRLTVVRFTGLTLPDSLSLVSAS